jgi:adenylate cyclase
MSIRAKVVLLVLPLIVAPLLLTGFIASLSARNGITSVATRLLAFKMDALLNYANSQWSLLVENNFVGNPEYVAAARAAAASYAQTLVRNDSELIFALDAEGNVAMSTGPLALSAEEHSALLKLAGSGVTGWVQLTAGGAARVAQAGRFSPFGWYVLVTERRDTFYQATSEIFLRTGLILSASLVIAIVLLVIFSFLMTQPLRLIAGAMREIMRTNDLSRRVEILYRDETGELGHSFNLMTGELEKAYTQIKGYALDAAIAQHRERKVRTIFQKYVPESVINEFFTRPESMLVGQKRTLAILFSDIRSFTSISEGLTSAQIVESLNDYFAIMVEIIQDRHGGIVDKYIGDAIMAFFGAPVRRDDDAFRAVMAGFEMLDSVRGFNATQVSKGRPPFRIGVGINYGEVTLGNIGSEKKMDYTIIGDEVNIASRLEGLTKQYKEEVVVSERVARFLDGKIPCRQLDKVRVVGKKEETRIFTPHRDLTSSEEEAWKLHEQALGLYYKRDFRAAQKAFEEVLHLLPEDVCAATFAQRCIKYVRSPPPDSWTGAFILTEK